MELQSNNLPENEIKRIHPVYQITAVSKYLALFLFIVLPFIGGYIGFQLAIVNKSLPSNSSLLTQENADVELDIEKNTSDLDGTQQVTFNGEPTGYFIQNNSVYYDNVTYGYVGDDYKEIRRDKILLDADAKSFRVVMSDPIEKIMLYSADNKKVFYFEKELPGAIGLGAEMVEEQSGYIVADGGLYQGEALLIEGEKKDFLVFDMVAYNGMPAKGWASVYVLNQKQNQWYALGRTGGLLKVEKPDDISLGELKYGIIQNYNATRTPS